MKKRVFFALFLFFLCFGAWGANLEWTGADFWASGNNQSWTNSGNWDNGGIPSTFYPSTGDTAIFSENTPTVIVFLATDTTIDKLEIDCYLEFSGYPYYLNITNLTIGSGGYLNNGRVCMGNGDVSLDLNELIITGVTGDIGDIDAGDRDVKIIVNGTSSVNIGKITTTGNVTIETTNGGSGETLFLDTISSTASSVTLELGGTWVIDAGGNTFNAVIIESGADIELASSLYVKGDLTIDGALNADSNGISLTGGKWDLTGMGTFNSGVGIVYFNNAEVYGDNNASNAFNKVICDGTVSFENGKTQEIGVSLQINDGATLSAITSGVSGSRWILNIFDSSSIVLSGSAPLPTIKDCDSVNSLNMDGTNVKNGGNNNNVFISRKFFWTGANSTNDWHEPGNWEDESSTPYISDYPQLSTDIVVIDGGYFVQLNVGGVAIDQLTISDNAFLELSSGSPLEVNNLTMDHSTLDMYDSLTVNGDVTVENLGVLAANSSDVTVSGSWDTSGGDFNSGNSTVKFTGSGAIERANGDDFYNVEISGDYNLVGLEGLEANEITVTGKLDLGHSQLYANTLTIEDFGEVINVDAMNFTVSELNFGDGLLNISLNGGYTVDTLVIYGEATISGNALFVENTGELDLSDSSASIAISGTVYFGGGTVSTNNSSPHIEINNVKSDTGTLNAGSKDVEITVDSGGTGSLLTLGTITAASKVNLSVDGRWTLNSGSNTFNSVTVESGADITLGSDLTTGNLTIDGALDADAKTINLTDGEWNLNGGTFTNGGGTVNFTDATVKGSSTFNKVVCVGAVKFENGSTQGISVLVATAATSLTAIDTSSGSQRWKISTLTAANFTTSPTTSISWCEPTNVLGRTTGAGPNQAANGGDNHANVFSSASVTDYYWNGSVSNDWEDPDNWEDDVGAPVSDYPRLSTDIVFIPDIGMGPYPVLLNDVTCGELTINADASLNLAGCNLTVATSLTNDGTIELYGNSGQVTVASAAPTSPGSTIRYYGGGTGEWVFGDTYDNLIISNKTMDSVTSSISSTSATFDSGVTITTTGGFFTTTSASGSGGVTIYANQGITISGGTLSGSVTLNNNQGASQTGNISFANAPAIAGSTITLSSTNGASNGTITVTHNGIISVNGITSTGGAISLEGESISVSSGITTKGTNGLASSANIDLTANGDSSGVGSIKGSGGVIGATLTASTNVDDSGSGGGVSIALDATGNAVTGFTTGTTSNPTGSVSLTGNTVATLTIVTGGVKGVGVTIENTGNIVVNNAVAGGTGTVSITTTETGGNITGNGTISGNGVSLTTTNSGYINRVATGTISSNNGAAIDPDPAAVNLTAAEYITNTGAITGSALTVKSGDAITLTATTNAVETLTVTGAGGAVQFTNNAALAIGGIAKVPAVGSPTQLSVDVTIKTTGTTPNITQASDTAILTTGALTLNTTGTITLGNEDASNIPLNSVSALNVTSVSGDVVFTNSAALNVTVDNSSAANVTINSGGNINVTTITASGTVYLNAGYPSHKVFGTSGDVTITDLSAANLEIWGENIISVSGVKSLSNCIRLWSDHDQDENVITSAFGKSIGGNNRWVCRGDLTFIWKGFDDDVWANDANWAYGVAPVFNAGDSGKDLHIYVDPNGGYDAESPYAITVGELRVINGTLTLGGDLTATSVSIETDTMNDPPETTGILDIAGYDVSVSGTFYNNGELHLIGISSSTISIPTNNTSSSLVKYYDSSSPPLTTVSLKDITDFGRIELAGGAVNTIGSISVSTELIISGGTTGHIMDEDLSAPKVTISGGQLNINDGKTLSAVGSSGTGVFEQSGGILNISSGTTGTLITDGTAAQIDGDGNGSIDGEISGGGTLILGGNGSFDLQSATNNVGTLVVTGAGGTGVKYSNAAALIIGGIANVPAVGTPTQLGVDVKITAGGDITQTTSTGTILISQTLELNSAGAITLDKLDGSNVPLNKVSKLKITGAGVGSGNEVQFTNLGNLEIGGIANVPAVGTPTQLNQNVTITTKSENASNDGDITQTTNTAILISATLTVNAYGSITLDSKNSSDVYLNIAVTVSLNKTSGTSVAGNITYQSSRGSGNTMVVTANTNNGTVEIIENNGSLEVGVASPYGIYASGTIYLEAAETVTITGNIYTESKGTDVHGKHVAAVCVDTEEFKGTGNITTQTETDGTLGHICVYLKKDPNYSGNAPRIHYHTDCHIVYRKGTNPGYIPGVGYYNLSTRDYTYVDSDYYKGVSLTPGNGYNIYIISTEDLGSAAANTFITNGNGSKIEFRGKYEASSINLIFDNNHGHLSFDNDYLLGGYTGTGIPATIELTSGSFSIVTSGSSAPVNLTLNGGTGTGAVGSTLGPSSIKAVGISISGTIEGTTPGANNLNLNSINSDPTPVAQNITISNAMGGDPSASGIRLGDITVVNAATAYFGGQVWAKSFTQDAGTTATTFNAAQNYAGAFAFTGKDLTINSTLTASTSPESVSNTVTIKNTGTFTQSAGANITSDGAFSQTTVPSIATPDVKSILNANITTGYTSSPASISFAGPITISGSAVEHNTSAGNGNATYSSTIAGNSSNDNPLTISVGTGTVKFNDTVGISALPLGDITVNVNIGSGPTPPPGVTVSGNVYAKSFTQTGTGTASVGANINATGVTSTVTVISIAGDLTLTNNVTFAVPFSTGGFFKLPTNVYSQTSPRTLTLSGGSSSSATAGLTYSGASLHNISFDGNVTIAANSYVVIESNIQIDQSSGKSLTLNTGTTRTTTLDTSPGTWMIGGTGSTGYFTGGNGALTLGAGTKEISSRLITNNLTLISPFTVTNSTTGWSYIQVKGATTTLTNPTLSGDFPRLILDMNGSGNQYLTASELGSLHIRSGLITFLSSDLKINGEVRIEYVSQTSGVLNAGSNNITMIAGIRETGYYYNYGNNVRTNHPGAYVGRWENVGVPESVANPNGGVGNQHAFIHNGTVKFEAPASMPSNVFFEIIGNTVWYKFECVNPATDIKFLFSTSTNSTPDHHVFRKKFTATGTTSNFITFTRYVGDNVSKTNWYQEYDNINSDPPSSIAGENMTTTGLPMYPQVANLKNSTDSNIDKERIKFWNFSIAPVDNSEPVYKIERITVYFSHAWNQPVPIADGMNVNIVPYYRPPRPSVSRLGYFNYNWIELRRIIYSYAEDSNGNGKVDRIRAQTNVVLKDKSAGKNFAGFDVDVTGYKVTGYKMLIDVLAPANVHPDGEDEKSFYIYLEEGPDLYDGAPIHWKVINNNNTLVDDKTWEFLVGDPALGEDYYTINTIPPRVTLALTLPGHNETFVKMSQPVYGNPDAQITGTHVASAGHSIEKSATAPAYDEILKYYPFDDDPVLFNLRPISDWDKGALNYLIRLKDIPNVSNLAKYPRIGAFDPGDWYFVTRDIKSMSVRALDWNDPKVDRDNLMLYMEYPAPRYPVDWNYSGYKPYNGNSHAAHKDGGLLTQDNDPAYATNPHPVNDIFLPPYRVLPPGMIDKLERYAAGDAAVGKVTPADVNTPAPADEWKLRRRLTDVLISREPTAASNSVYFAWPVWASYFEKSQHPGFVWDDLLWDMDSDDGIIWNFDGKKFLQARDITLQARSHNLISALTGYEGMSLFFGNAPTGEGYRMPDERGERGKVTGGLWLPLPRGDINPRFSILRYFYPGFKTADIDGTAGPLTTFILKQNGNFESGEKLEFFLRLNWRADQNVDPNVVVARLATDAPGSAVPPRWWEQIRPFGFDLQNLRPQRGGVTIRNNVINSENREKVFISYHLVRPGRVTIQVYTLDGSLVKSLRRNENRETGEWTETWDGTNNAGRPVARGMYFVRIVAPDIDEIRKVMVIK